MCSRLSTFTCIRVLTLDTTKLSFLCVNITGDIKHFVQISILLNKPEMAEIYISFSGYIKSTKRETTMGNAKIKSI